MADGESSPTQRVRMPRMQANCLLSLCTARPAAASVRMCGERVHVQPQPVAPAMPAISQYIKALSSSGGHQKLVLKGPSFPKKGEITRGGSGGGAVITNSAVAERREEKRRAKQQTMLDIMMLLDTNHLSDIRKEFIDAEDGLELVAFVEAMLKYLSKDDVDEKHLVASLCELFAQVDVNGDATMEWEEFYEYIHEQGMADNDTMNRLMMKYNERPWWEDRSLPKKIDSICHYEGTDWVGIIEHNSVHLQIYDITARREVYTLTHKAAVLMSELVLHKGKKLMIVSTCDYAITVWDTQSVWEASGFAIISNKPDGTPLMIAPDSQMTLMWDGDTGTLFSGGVNGSMHCWDLNTFEAKPARFNCVKDSSKSSVRVILDVPELNGVLTGTLDGSMMLFDKTFSVPGVKKPRKVYKGHRNGILAIAYAPSLKLIVSVGIRDELFVWNPFVEKRVSDLPGHRQPMLGLDLVGHEREHVLSVDKSGVFKVWDLRTLALVQTFTAAPDLNGVRYYLNLSHRRVIVAAHHRRFQEFEFSYSNTPDLTDDEDIVMGIYNETMDAIITAAGCNVRIWESSTGHPVKTFSNVSAAPIVSICLDDRCTVGVSQCL